MKQILAVINYWPDAEVLLRRARHIAEALEAEVYVYCPVSSEIEEMNRYVGFENFEEVKQELIDETLSRLKALPDIGDLQTDVEWRSRLYRGVADKAESLAAEMILMSRSDHNIVGDFLHKPDDWHLLRDAPCPVLILNREHNPYHAVVAAVDALEDNEEHHSLNARILDEARMMSEILRLPLNVVTVVPEPAYVYSDMTAVNSVVIDQFREESEALARAEQKKMLSRLGIQPHAATVVLGRVETVLQHSLSEAGLLVLGTIANKGLKGFFIGNTCERLLSHLEGDMLVVN